MWGRVGLDQRWKSANVSFHNKLPVAAYRPARRDVALDFKKTNDGRPAKSEVFDILLTSKMAVAE